MRCLNPPGPLPARDLSQDSRSVQRLRAHRPQMAALKLGSYVLAVLKITDREAARWL